MERVDQFRFYSMGAALQRLKTLSENPGSSDIFFTLWDGADTIQDLLNGKPIQLGVSRVKATELHARIESVLDKHFKKTNESGELAWSLPKEGDDPIPSWSLSSVKTALTAFETVFKEEMREAATYKVPDRGIFNTGKLVDHADATFPQTLTKYIPQKARDDWQSAGRCLAFNLLSASGFHVARAVEGMLESYYRAATGTDDVLKGWHDYIVALESAKKTPKTPFCPSDKVISILKQMKDDFRNPIMHPRVVLTDADSRILFASGAALLIAMAQELCLQEAHVAPSLAFPVKQNLLAAE